MMRYDVLIVGGGLAGLTAAIHLARKGKSVGLFEKERYPHHKVCGEYVSNEVIPYLYSLGVRLPDTTVAIDTLQLSTVKGQSLALKLPLGGIGISRYAFDELLYQHALSTGVEFIFKAVRSISFQQNVFRCIDANGTNYEAMVAIGAYGKRSLIDKQLNRDFINQKSSWLGVKCHYDFPNLPDNQVALHNFNGGYGGLSRTESGTVNFCYLASYKSFKRFKDIDSFNREVVCRNPFLDEFLGKASPVFQTPLTIAQISFEPKRIVEDHIIMCGDAAGLIHPLCGNGMAMAIHSAKIAAENILVFFDEDSYSRKRLELDYTAEWKANFSKRMAIGQRLQSVLLNETLSSVAMATVAKSTWLLQKLITQTHGKPIKC